MRCALAPIRRSFSMSVGLGALRLELADEVLGVDRDRGQRVVELVDDAGGELAEGREPLGAHDLLLEHLDLGLILADRDDRLDRPARRAGAADRRDAPHRADRPPAARRQRDRDRGVVLAEQRGRERGRQVLALIARR